MINNRLQVKLKILAKILKSYNNFALALSGGIDSIFLLTFAKKILGSVNLLAITARSIIHFDNDIKDALRLTNKLGINHLFFHSKEIYLDEFITNKKNRCYFCKKSMFESIHLIASKNGFKNIVHGANLDDTNDYRPGFKAANEFGVLAPLIEANLSKEDIRYVSRAYDIDIWNKPATSCVATRLPYEIKINIKNIKQVKKAELILSNQGFKLCRVRHHGNTARIEINMSQISHIINPQIREKIVKAFKKIGYNHISLDLEGYKQGSMNNDVI